MASSRTTALTSFGLGVALTIAGATFTSSLNLGGNDISNIATGSAATLKAGGGTTTLTRDIRTETAEATTLSGATVRTTNGGVKLTANTASGGKLTATPVSGTAGLVIYGGAKGSHICLADTDAAGWSACDALNGTLTCRIATAGECP